MKKNKKLFIFIAFFVVHVLLFIMLEHYFNFKGIQMSWTEIAEDWLNVIIVGFVLATISTILWINHKKDNE